MRFPSRFFAVPLLALAVLAATFGPLHATDTPTKDLKHLKQDDPRGFDSGTTTADVNCTPTAAIMCLEWWTRHGFAGLVPNANDDQLYAAVKTFGQQGGINGRGFGWHGLGEALKEWLRKHGHQDMKATPHDDDCSFDAIKTQFAPTTSNPNGQDVIWLGLQVSQDKTGQDIEGAGHTMTMESMELKTTVAIPGDDKPGHKVSMADPATGAKHDFVMSAAGDLYEGTPLKKAYRRQGFYTVCPP